jgi:hypothetical protein
MWLRNAYIMYVPDAAKEYRADYPVGFTVRPFRGHKQLGGGWVDDGFGHRMIRLVGWTPPGGQSAMSVSYTLPPGTFTTDSASALEYQLQAEPQSLFIPSTLTVQVTPPAGYAPERQPGMKITNATATVSAVQGAPVNVSIAFEKQP